MSVGTLTWLISAVDWELALGSSVTSSLSGTYVRNGRMKLSGKLDTVMSSVTSRAARYPDVGVVFEFGGRFALAGVFGATDGPY